MKKIIAVLCLLATPAVAEQKHMFDRSYNNQMIRECLDVWGMDRSIEDVDARFAKIDFQNAAGCTSGFVLSKQKEQVKKDQEFLKQNPWFKGTNWKWQEKAEYTCTKEHHTGRTVCQKPYYLN